VLFFSGSYSRTSGGNYRFITAVYVMPGKRHTSSLAKQTIFSSWRKMWWEIIPSLAIICAGIAAPFYTTFYSHKLILGKYCRRPRKDYHDKNFWDRDEQLTGWPYDTLGLDAIPDEPVPASQRPRARDPWIKLNASLGRRGHQSINHMFSLWGCQSLFIWTKINW